MPIIKSAKKKLKQDRVRTTRNKKTKISYKKSLKKAKTKPSKKTVSSAYSDIDKAVKRGVIHKNKAARLKKHAAHHAKG